MSTKLRNKTSSKKLTRFRRKRRLRARIFGTAERPRLVVFRSNRRIYVQLVDDTRGQTVVSVSSLEESFRAKPGKTVETARLLGETIAKRALTKKIERIVFDRSGYLYHGRLKTLADAAREAGLSL